MKNLKTLLPLSVNFTTNSISNGGENVVGTINDGNYLIYSNSSVIERYYDVFNPHFHLHNPSIYFGNSLSRNLFPL